MKHFTLMTAVVLCLFVCTTSSMAADLDIGRLVQIDENGEFKNDGHTFSTQEGYYVEWDHYYVCWDKDYGKQSYPNYITTLGVGDDLINLSDLKVWADRCYDLYVNQLGFAVPQHKFLILLFRSSSWYADANGWGGYGMLRLAHSSVNGNYFTFCHEIGHVFQFGCRGLQSSSAFNSTSYYISYFEATANWQASQLYPNQYFPTCYDLYQQTTHYALQHEWHGYQYYPINDYFITLHDEQAVGKIWSTRPNNRNNDMLQMYMQIYDVSAEELYREIFWEAMRTVTWDLPRWEHYLQASGTPNSSYMGWTNSTSSGTRVSWQYVTLDSEQAQYQVAYGSCPMSTGFNIIKLAVPTTTDRTVTTSFTALEPGCALQEKDQKAYWDGGQWAIVSNATNYNTRLCSGGSSDFDTFKNWRGFRLGYVAYNSKTGERFYNYADEVFCSGTDEQTVNFQYTVPADCDQLYLVVSPSLSQYLRRGGNNPYYTDATNNVFLGEHWPYRVQFYGTNLFGRDLPATTFEGDAISGTTYTTYSLPDFAEIVSKTAYTLALNDEAPEVGRIDTAPYVYEGDDDDQYLAINPITTDNVWSNLYPFELPGYVCGMTVDGNTINLNYNKVADETLVTINSKESLQGSDNSRRLTTLNLKETLAFFDTDMATFTSADDYPFYAIDGTTGQMTLCDKDDDGLYVCYFNTDGSLATSDDYTYKVYYDKSHPNADKYVILGYTVSDQLPVGTTSTLQTAILQDGRMAKFIFHITIANKAVTGKATHIQVESGSPEGAGFQTAHLTFNPYFGTYMGANISVNNVNSYVIPNEIEGYTPEFDIAGNLVTLRYKTIETGIASVNEQRSMVDGAIYDLSGRRVDHPTKGIYIRNGKKFLIR